jgi:uncharacterized glyoxalase superfamily protein PhnB
LSLRLIPTLVMDGNAKEAIQFVREYSMPKSFISTVQDGNKVVINLSTKDVEKTKQIFGWLQHDGKVVAPLEEVPFSPTFGTVTDKFGVTFIIDRRQKLIKRVQTLIVLHSFFIYLLSC